MPIYWFEQDAGERLRLVLKLKSINFEDQAAHPLLVLRPEPLRVPPHQRPQHQRGQRHKPTYRQVRTWDPLPKRLHTAKLPQQLRRYPLKHRYRLVQPNQPHPPHLLPDRAKGILRLQEGRAHPFLLPVAMGQLHPLQEVPVLQSGVEPRGLGIPRSPCVPEQPEGQGADEDGEMRPTRFPIDLIRRLHRRALIRENSRGFGPSSQAGEGKPVGRTFLISNTFGTDMAREQKGHRVPRQTAFQKVRGHQVLNIHQQQKLPANFRRIGR